MRARSLPLRALSALSVSDASVASARAARVSSASAASSGRTAAAPRASSAATVSLSRKRLSAAPSSSLDSISSSICDVWRASCPNKDCTSLPMSDASTPWSPRSASTDVGRILHPHQIHDLQLQPVNAAPYVRHHDAPRASIAKGARAGQEYRRQLHVAQHLPEADALPVHRQARRLFVHSVELLPLHQPADALIACPAPGPDARPGDILQRVAQVRHLPVQERLDLTALVKQEVPRPVVLVDKDDALGRRRQVAAKPAARRAQDRLRLQGVPFDDRLPLLDLGYAAGRSVGGGGPGAPPPPPPGPRQEPRPHRP